MQVQVTGAPVFTIGFSFSALKLWPWQINSSLVVTITKGFSDRVWSDLLLSGQMSATLCN